MFITDAVILHGARTPMARYTGAFDDTTAIELGAARRGKRSAAPAPIPANSTMLFSGT